MSAQAPAPDPQHDTNRARETEYRRLRAQNIESDTTESKQDTPAGRPALDPITRETIEGLPRVSARRREPGGPTGVNAGGSEPAASTTALGAPARTSRRWWGRPVIVGAVGVLALVAGVAVRRRLGASAGPPAGSSQPSSSPDTGGGDGDWLVI